MLLVISTFSSQAMMDGNHNGLSDVWEMTYNNGVTFSNTSIEHDAASDPDKDGWSNAQECLAGTNPFDGSAPRGKTTLRIEAAIQQSSYKLTWAAIPGKMYRLQTSSNLQFWANVGPWMEAGATADQLNIGVQSENLLAADSSSPARLYWRIKVSDSDSDVDGLSTADEYLLGLNPLQSSTIPGILDQVVTNRYATQLMSTGISGIQLDIDPDGDGSTNRQELIDDTDPGIPDTDGDGKLDGEDAAPKDEEIDWVKVPATQYLWLTQVNQISTKLSDHRPIAINKDGQVLFRDARLELHQISQQQNLWDCTSGQWVTLPLNGAQEIDIGPHDIAMSWTYNGVTVNVAPGQEQFNLIEPVIEFIDINDQGVIFGLAKGENYVKIDPLIPGMVWKKSGTSLTQYAAPSYFFPKYPFPTGTPSSVVHNTYYNGVGIDRRMFGGIANDGTINALCSASEVGQNVWMHYDTSTTTRSMTSVKELDQDIDTNYTFPGAILDKDRSLCIERLELDASGWTSKVWLKEGDSLSELSFMTEETIELAELNETPNRKTDGTKRLWVSTGDTCHIEKRIGGTGFTRWHKPSSMAEGAIRLSDQGIAITSGDPSLSNAIPPKLWRNGKYIDLNDLITKPEGSTLKIIKAIDLASNGIILVQATEGGITKTGILKPIPLP